MEKYKLRECKKVGTSLVVVQWLRIHLAEKKKKKNPPCNAGGAGLIPGLGTKIPHSGEQLNLRTETTEPTCHN